MAHRHGRSVVTETSGPSEQRHKIHQNLLVKLQKAHTVEDVGRVLADIQKMFGFLWYYVLDTSRLTQIEPVSFVFPSNIPADFFCELEEFLADYASVFINATEALGPSRCDLDEALEKGRMSQEAGDVFRASSMIRGATFPALGLSGAPRLIGFSGERHHLSIEEIEELNVLTVQVHARLTTVWPHSNEHRQPLSGLERQALSLAAEGESFEIIATKLALSNRTITYLIDSICRKMEVATIEHAVALIMRRGMIL